MRSRRRALSWLIAKDWRELLASPAWWVFLAAVGPLVGLSFVEAVRTYAEVSGLGGSGAGGGEAFSPLIGVWAPTFGACELAAAFLLPFVGIRVFAGDAQSGALKLESQGPCAPPIRVASKMVVLLAGWTIASLAPVIAIPLWTSSGGHVYAPEIVSVAAGHFLNAALVIGLAAAAASMTQHPSTAAIVTLAVTVGTWALTFIAAVHGGAWEVAAGYTPTALVAQFQHGLVRLDVLLIAAVFFSTLAAAAALSLRLAVPVRRRVRDGVVLAIVAALALWACTFARSSWDVSENRANSFPRRDERALKQIDAPLHLIVRLAPQDPRRLDLDRRVVSKLRRAVSSLQVDYRSTTSIGLFEQSDPHYGEITIELAGRSTSTRATSADAVLDAIYDLSRVRPDPGEPDDEFSGYPVAARPAAAGWIFFVLWPAATGMAWFLTRYRL